MYEGVDISTWQKNIDWKKLKKHVDFVIIRAGFGTTEDNMFKTHIENAAAEKIPVGVYWFSYAIDEGAAALEAKKCLEVIEGYHISYPVAFDFEYDSLSYAENRGVKHTKDSVTLAIKTFCEIIERAGYLPMVYANPDFLKRYIDMQKIKADLWLAAWGSKDESKNCQIWQYHVLGNESEVKAGIATKVGKIDGISGAIDINRSYIDYAKERPYPTEEKPTKPEPEPEKPKLVEFATGDIAYFSGDKQYSWSKGTDSVPAKQGTVKITETAYFSDHQYHARSINDKGKYIAGVYGWVDAGDLKPVSETIVTPGEDGGVEITHVVKKGDTLWGIAVLYYGNGFKFTKIMTANKMISPIIYAGRKLKIPK